MRTTQTWLEHWHLSYKLPWEFHQNVQPPSIQSTTWQGVKRQAVGVSIAWRFDHYAQCDSLIQGCICLGSCDQCQGDSREMSLMFYTHMINRSQGWIITGLTLASLICLAGLACIDVYNTILSSAIHSYIRKVYIYIPTDPGVCLVPMQFLEG